MGDFDIDTALADAWGDYRHHLGGLLSVLAIGDHYVVAHTSEIPEVRHVRIGFTVTGAHRVRATISGADLTATPGAPATLARGLRLLGWRRLRDGSHISEVGRRRIDDLASRAVATFREIWGVVHPVFLDGPDPGPREPVLQWTRLPHDHRELRTLVIDSLESMAGEPLVVDDDGDIPLPTGEVRSWLRVMPDRPTLEFFGTIVPEVRDVGAAYEFVATRSVEYTGIKLLVHGTCVVAVLTVEVTAFSRHNMAVGLGQWLQFVADVRPEILAELTETLPPRSPKPLPPHRKP
ncbi:hypothetical protein [Gordonia sp. NB41Y]|uniref:TY-Chap domain-containing protein n=1 Tax=Gordonia sp. NB41Y TaxID=875808 RepID=UPI0006B18696|nr:hypothetical protein [Gordonia sp. NB41Y]EMP12523.2 hypothetical protein ISGA_3494 [Gordonia sp. NB41Y]WLP92900.1 hypothetical protein Q9K23_12095 [Gordonia sp. NB41Y]